MEDKPVVKALVLDAHPLINQHYNDLKKYAEKFYVSVSVYKEIKDENARKNLEFWKDSLIIRQPKSESIRKVAEFAKKTGDYAVLSANDIHIIALAYELEVEHNGPDFNVKKENVKIEKNQEETAQGEWKTVGKKPRRRGGKKQREKRLAQMKEQEQKDEGSKEQIEKQTETISTTSAKDAGKPEEVQEETLKVEAEIPESVSVAEESVDQVLLDVPSKSATDAEDAVEAEEFEESDDDGEWITAENLADKVFKDGKEQEEAIIEQATVALSSQDFAVQNVAIQLGLKLMNTSTGLQIRKIRTYMMRCHACFRLQPITESLQVAKKLFCDYCGGDTLLRCSVIIDAKTGELKPLLKKNFEWHHKGNKYSIPSPLSKATLKKQGRGGFQHNKNSKNFDVYNNVPLLRADQKEYLKAMKNEKWKQRQDEKALENWIGGGSAENFYSPFAN